MKTANILLAGFGGQGILFAGKFLAYSGLYENRQLSWLPSYGPEMRGGTCNCSVILSDDPVGSPIVSTPNVLMVMNLPSLDKYEASAAPGAKLFVDSTLIERKVNRTDVEVFYIPATQMAADMGIPTLANMILVGKIIKETDVVSFDNMDAVLAKVISAKRQDMLGVNKQALEAGYNYKD